MRPYKPLRGWLGNCSLRAIPGWVYPLRWHFVTAKASKAGHLGDGNWLGKGDLCRIVGTHFCRAVRVSVYLLIINRLCHCRGRRRGIPPGGWWRGGYLILFCRIKISAETRYVMIVLPDVELLCKQVRSCFAVVRSEGSVVPTGLRLGWGTLTQGSPPKGNRI